MNDNVLDELARLDPAVAAPRLSRLLAEHPTDRTEILKRVRDRSPALYAEWLAKAAGY